VASDCDQCTYGVLLSAILTCIACFVLRQFESIQGDFLCEVQNLSTTRCFVVKVFVELSLRQKFFQVESDAGTKPSPLLITALFELDT